MIWPVDSIYREVGFVEQVAADWAAWDDTYRFVLDRNESYIESNFQWSLLNLRGLTCCTCLTQIRMSSGARLFHRDGRACKSG